jgi:hypothetical protein
VDADYGSGLSDAFNEAAQPEVEGSLSEAFNEAAQPEGEGSLSEAFNEAAQPEVDDEGALGGDGGDGSQGTTDAGALMTELEPGLDDGQQTSAEGSLSEAFNEAAQPEVEGSLSEAFNEAAQPEVDDGGAQRGDGTEGSQGATDAGALTTELEPGLDDGQQTSADTDEEAEAAVDADADADATAQENEANALGAEAAGLRAQFNRAAVAGDQDEAADVGADAEATEEDAAVQRSQAQQLRNKGPRM